MPERSSHEEWTPEELAPGPLQAETAPMNFYFADGLRPEGAPPAEYDLEKRALSATQPIYVQNVDDIKPVNYGTTWPVKVERPAPKQEWHFIDDRGLSIKIAHILRSLILPPLLLGYVSWIMTFSTHFNFPRFVWLFAAVGFIPVWISARIRNKAHAQGLATGWPTHLTIMMALAFFLALVACEINYWFFMHPFYTLRTMKDYSNIDPAETSAGQMMDAAAVTFVPGTKVAEDLSMAFISWDHYCVAPISTAPGLPSQGGRLNEYDFWAVGINCCETGGFGFSCGHVSDVKAHSGLRLVDNEQLEYFRLAVQQAEAAYGFRAENPAFFHWVRDATAEMNLFFESGFQNFIFLYSAFFVFNVVALIVRIMALHKPHKSSAMLGADQH